MDNFISILRDAASPEELEELKVMLFRENVRIRTDKTELEELREHLGVEQKKLDDYENSLEIKRKQLDVETKQLKKELQSERRRLQEDSIFFDKKQMVLEQAFKQLDYERRKFEKEKEGFRIERQNRENSGYVQFPEFRQGVFFRGVTNSLALKKRYKDLLKIFHPDNMSGDNDTLLQINKEYEMLKRDINI